MGVPTLGAVADMEFRLRKGEIFEVDQETGHKGSPEVSRLAVRSVDQVLDWLRKIYINTDILGERCSYTVDWIAIESLGSIPQRNFRRHDSDLSRWHEGHVIESPPPSTTGMNQKFQLELFTQLVLGQSM